MFALCCTINGETKITKCQSEAMQIMYGASTEQVPTWQCKQNEKN